MRFAFSASALFALAATPSFVHGATPDLLGPGATVSASAGSCTTSRVPIRVSNAQNMRFRNLTTPRNQLDVAAFGLLSNQINSNITKQQIVGTQNVTQTFQIQTTVCTPKRQWDGVVEILVHGIGPDRRYWFDASDPKSSFAEAALNAGHAVVAYDRLGTGGSDAPDGLKIVQSATDVAVLQGIITKVKSDNRFKNAKSFVGVGHSFGSIQLSGIAVQYPKLLDKIVFTGYSTSNASIGLFNFAFSSTIAFQQNALRYARYAKDNSYWVSAAPGNDLISFFEPGFFTTQAFNYFQSIKQPFTFGEAITMMGPSMMLPARGFTGQILIATGQHDLPFCGGDCYQPPTTVQGTTLLDDAKPQYPAASKFSIYVAPNTGHAVNGHVTAAATYAIINRFINGTYT